MYKFVAVPQLFLFTRPLQFILVYIQELNYRQNIAKCLSQYPEKKHPDVFTLALVQLHVA